MFKEYEELSDCDLYKLAYIISSLCEQNPYEKEDYLWIKSRIRLIMKILIKEEKNDE